MMEHKCADNRDVIEFGNGAWWLHANWTLRIRVEYCPYCGLKLEPPKPEFDAKAYKEAADIIDKQWQRAMDQLVKQTERPDGIIEVRRETLDGWISELSGVNFAASRTRKLEGANRKKVFWHIGNLWRSIRKVGGYDD